MDKAIIIAGSYAELIAREKQGERLELGELLVCEGDEKMLLQVTDLSYGSQISQQNRELLSGLALEDDVELYMSDSQLRTYTLAKLKSLLNLPLMTAPKRMPQVFSGVRAVTKDDLHFEQPANALFLGNLRSGSKELAVAVHIGGKECLTHHVLVASTTGRGKSNLMKVLLQDLLDKDFCSVLVFDPHAEYAAALSGKRLSVYTKDAAPGEYSLKINLAVLRPAHFDGVAEWTDAQRDGLRLYYKRFREEWIERVLIDETPVPGIMEGTLGVMKRKLGLLLSLDVEDGLLVSRGVFDTHSGRGTMTDIAGKLASGAVIVVETASLSDAAEVLMATLISTEAYEQWKRQRISRVLSICLEEAPRFIGEEALASGPNVFSQIAREGRKFNVGLIGITQLPSLIPRQVLANMNTKIILGIEMAPERKAIIESSSQDLSSDDRIIASLERGEAIVTSTFTHFAIPIKIPLHKKRTEQPKSVPGLKAAP